MLHEKALKEYYILTVSCLINFRTKKRHKDIMCLIILPGHSRIPFQSSLHLGPIGRLVHQKVDTPVKISLSKCYTGRHGNKGTKLNELVLGSTRCSKCTDTCLLIHSKTYTHFIYGPELSPSSPWGRIRKSVVL